MAYKPQYCPGQSHIAENRRKQLDPSHKLEKLRDVTDKDIVLVMGHKAPGAAYPSAHPPLSEQQEPACPIRKLVTPTDGAKAGDRVRYIQFTDSMYNAPCQPYQRSWLEAYRFRGIDPVRCQDVKSLSAVREISKSMQRNSLTPSSSMQHLPASAAVPCTDTPSVSMRTE